MVAALHCSVNDSACSAAPVATMQIAYCIAASACARPLLGSCVMSLCLPDLASVADQEGAAVLTPAPLACARLLLADGVVAALLTARLDAHGLVEEGVAALLVPLGLAVVHEAHAGAVDDVVLVVHALVHLQPRRRESSPVRSIFCTCAKAGGLRQYQLELCLSSFRCRVC